MRCNRSSTYMQVSNFGRFSASKSGNRLVCRLPYAWEYAVICEHGHDKLHTSQYTQTLSYTSPVYDMLYEDTLHTSQYTQTLSYTSPVYDMLYEDTLIWYVIWGHTYKISCLTLLLLMSLFINTSCSGFWFNYEISLDSWPLLRAMAAVLYSNSVRNCTLHDSIYSTLTMT